MTSAERTSTEILDDEECWRLLGVETVGRLAVTSTHGLEIFPVNYLVKGRMIHFASAPGTKLMGVVAHPGVAFEVDHVDGPIWWSVVARGTAERMSSGLDIEDSGVRRIASGSPGNKWNYVRISVDEISGRRTTARLPTR
jgi:nitroimidazol reductase NimA-like FMN-containing flavoprotein (pyridoxamine 5'-phosphate oxidase superfamily)